jgi:hypothetical protein
VFYLGLGDKDVKSGARSREAFERGLRHTVETYRNLGAEVYVITQAPQQRMNAKDIYYALYQKASNEEQALSLVKRYSIGVGEHEKLQAYNRGVLSSLAAEGRIRIVNLDALFCDASNCALGTAERPFYLDKDHLSHFGAHLTVGKLADLLKP